jgi:formylglycine-generating enzyme required for sulfatase activity
MAPTARRASAARARHVASRPHLLAAVAAVAAIVGCTAILGINPIPALERDGGDGDALSDGGDGGVLATSCKDSGGPGIDSCGPDGGESCCASSSVPGGTFLRGYDGVTFVDSSNPATVSAFRLDRFEVTVARFRRFVAAIGAGWRPALGAGKHSHLNGDAGLVVSPSDAGALFESGWDISWNDTLALVSRPDAGLACGDWTAAAGSNEVLPIGCITWFEAFAFCIWDGGFLPSEAEAAFAAAGGDEQRVFAWSNPPKSTSIDCTYANYRQSNGPPPTGCTGTTFAAPGATPRGDARWGHADLAGNAYEWALDGYGAYGNPCHDCVGAGAQSPLRGGGFTRADIDLHVANRFPAPRDYRAVDVGVRCARVP